MQNDNNKFLLIKFKYILYSNKDQCFYVYKGFVQLY